MASLAGITRVVGWACFAVLVAVQVADALQRSFPPLWWALALLPLLVFIPGLWRDHLRSYIWLCFVLLLYFINMVERLFVDPSDPVAVVGMAAVAGLFISAMLYVRWRARELRALEQSEST